MRSSVKKLGSVVSTTALIAFAEVSPVLAQSSEIGGIGGVNGDLISFVKSTLNLVIGLAALVAVGILVYNGIQYIIASGDEGKIEKATKGITYAIIGLVICFISVLIVNFVLQRVLKVG